MNKPIQQDQVGVVVPPSSSFISNNVPLIVKKTVNVYTGQTLHTSIPVYSEDQLQNIVGYYTDRGYITEVIQE